MCKLPMGKTSIHSNAFLEVGYVTPTTCALPPCNWKRLVEDISVSDSTRILVLVLVIARDKGTS